MGSGPKSPVPWVLGLVGGWGRFGEGLLGSGPEGALLWNLAPRKFWVVAPRNGDFLYNDVVKSMLWGVYFQKFRAGNGPAAHAPREIAPLKLLSFPARLGLRVGIYRLAGRERALKARTFWAVRAIKARAIPRGISTHILGSPRGKSTRKLRVPGGKLRAVLVATLWLFPAFRNSGGPVLVGKRRRSKYFPKVSKKS